MQAKCAQIRFMSLLKNYSRSKKEKGWNPLFGEIPAIISFNLQLIPKNLYYTELSSKFHLFQFPFSQGSVH